MNSLQEVPLPGMEKRKSVEYVKDQMWGNDDEDYLLFLAQEIGRDGVIYKEYKRRKETMFGNVARKLHVWVSCFSGLLNIYAAHFLNSYVLPAPLFNRDEYNYSDYSNEHWLRILFVALDVTPDTPLPCLHHLPRNYNSLTIVLRNRARDVNSVTRVAGLTKQKFATFGFYRQSALDHTKVLATFANFAEIQLPNIPDGFTWPVPMHIKNNESITMANFRHDDLGAVFFFWQLFKKQHPDLIDEKYKKGFEYPMIGREPEVSSD